LVAKSFGKIAVGRLKRGWEVNINIAFQEISCENNKWFEIG
jgi:hypothetical protein